MKISLDDTNILNKINTKLDTALIDISGNETDIKYFTNIGLWLSGKPDHNVKLNHNIMELYKIINRNEYKNTRADENSGTVLNFFPDPTKFKHLFNEFKKKLIEQIEKDTKILDIVKKIYDNVKDIKAGPYISDGVTYGEKTYKKTQITPKQLNLIKEIFDKYKKVTSVSSLFESTSTSYINNINNTFTELKKMIEDNDNIQEQDEDNIVYVYLNNLVKGEAFHTDIHYYQKKNEKEYADLGNFKNYNNDTEIYTFSNVEISKKKNDNYPNIYFIKEESKNYEGLFKENFYFVPNISHYPTEEIYKNKHVNKFSEEEFEPKEENEDNMIYDNIYQKKTKIGDGSVFIFTFILNDHKDYIKRLVNQKYANMYSKYTRKTYDADHEEISDKLYNNKIKEKNADNIEYSKLYTKANKDYSFDNDINRHYNANHDIANYTFYKAPDFDDYISNIKNGKYKTGGTKRKTRRNRKSNKGKRSRKARKSRRKSNRGRGRR